MSFDKNSNIMEDDVNLDSLSIENLSIWDDDDLVSNLNDDVVKVALNKGIDLREYAEQVKEDLRNVENNSIVDCINESSKIGNLHTQINSCNQILEKMESMLYGFQHDLSSISQEIQNLQEHSIDMNMKLKNRQLVKSELSQLVDEMVIPESMIIHILETPVTSRSFLEQLHELNHKINFIKQHSYHETAACRDVQDVVDKLKYKAITKIREYLIQKIYSLRKPMSNYHLIQDSMLRLRFFFEFLLSTERKVAKEVRDEYMETVSKVYFSYFKTYKSRLSKLQMDEATSSDLMAVEDSQRRSKLNNFFSTGIKPTFNKNRSSVFTLNKRDHVINEALEEAIIVPHASQKNEDKYTLEEIFRSYNFALLDTCCREYHFLSDFFMITSPQTTTEFFNFIFSKTLSYYLREIESWSHDCYDALGLFLCIHLVKRFKKLMEEKKVLHLSNYWKALDGILWPRFDQIVQLHIKSITDCNINNLSSIDNRPHYITRRYAEFSSAVNRIKDNEPSSRVERCLSNLQTEVQNFILRLAASFVDRKDQLAFLINNYDMLLSVLMERQGSENSSESESFQQLLNKRTMEYVEEILSPHFGGLIAFVRDCERIIESASQKSTPAQSNINERLKRYEHKVVPLVQGFASGWKTSVDLLSREVTTSFPNFKLGSVVVQAAFTQLIEYYHRFQKLFTQQPAPFKSMLNAKSQLVNMHLILVEMKKYKPNF